MAKHIVVLADDESDIRSFLKRVLTANDFLVHEAADGSEALEVLKTLGASADLLITDIKMPRMDGVALARCVAGLLPTLPVLFISGWTFDLFEAPEWRKPEYAFLQKPFLPKAFISSIEQLLARAEKRSAASTI
jgi:two-component system, cell cycle sensor histidine kinase and response regulator CckA